MHSGRQFLFSSLRESSHLAYSPMIPGLKHALNLRISSHLRIQCREYYKPNDGVLPRRDSRRTLSKTKADISSSRLADSRNILLPPFVSPGELRILLGIEYKSALAMCQVKLYQQKYYWSDIEGRWFETSNKRKILVPFEAIASSVKLFGLNPIKVDPEPQVPVTPDKARIPAISVFGKTNVAFGEVIENSKVTILPKPISDIMTGRQIKHSDAVVIVGDQVEDEFSVIDFCHRFNTPLIRLPNTDNLTRAVTAALSETQLVPESSLVDPLAIKFRAEKKRTDILVDAHKPPQASGIVLDVLKSVDTGKVGLVLVKRGQMRIGQHFVAGSGFGKITNMWTFGGERIEVASPGMLIKVGRLAKDTGDFSPDDFLHIFPKERAWRLAFHRERIEWLNSFQTEGRRLQVPFELDSAMDNTRNFAEEVTVDTPRAERIVGTNNFFDFDEPVDFSKLARGSILVEPETDESAEAIVARKQSAKVSTRWARRQESRAAARSMAERENEELKKLRTVIQTEQQVDEPTEPLGLPESLPVIPLIIKTESVSQFDAILDEIEQMEKTHRVKLPVVHGGIGPVTPNDLVHAEIESGFSPCSVYAVGIGVVPEAQQSAGSEDRIVSFKDIPSVLTAITARITRFKSANSRIKYSSGLKHAIR